MNARIENRKAGFTIIEMLVALALTIFMMYILSVAFAAGLKAFRDLKAVGDMEEQLRTAVTALRSDLRANHFDGSSRLGQLGLTGAYSPSHGYFCYTEGVYPPAATPSPAILEGVDPTTSFSRRSERDTNDFIGMTVRMNGNKRENYFYGLVPAGSSLDTAGRPAARYDDQTANGTYSSQWAEVIYFLGPDLQGRTTGTDALPVGGVTYQRLPMFNLYRRQRLLVPETFTDPSTAGFTAATPYATTSAGAVITPTTTPNVYSLYDVSVGPTAEPVTGPPATFGYVFNTPAEIQFRENRFNAGAAPFTLDANGHPSAPVTLAAQTGGLRAGADILMTNVVSWDVKVWDPKAVSVSGGGLRGEFVDLGHGGTGVTQPLNAGESWNTSATNPPWFYGNGNHAGTLPRVYDTWSSRKGDYDYSTTVAPYPQPIRAIQIRLRVWDQKTEQTREATIVVDM